MIRMTFWFYDLLAGIGTLLLLSGIYLACGLPMTLIVSGLLVLAVSLRLYFKAPNHDS